MRIIGGTARSRLIDAPRGMDTRPTQDKVRESLFNILQWEIEDGAVLDLFAGSGALALEALSRGASSAVMVDNSREAAKIIQGNIDRLGFSPKATVIQADWRAAADQLARQKAVFDLVFLDPPYKLTDTGEMCRYLLEKGILAPCAKLIVEHAWGTPPRLDTGLRASDLRRYGSTGITFVTLSAKEAD